MKLKVREKVQSPVIPPIIVLDAPFEEVTSTSTSKVSLDTLYDQAVSIQNKCKDFLVPCSGAKPLYLANTNSLRFTSEGEYSLTRYSLGQLCSKIGVPSSYIRKCLSSDMQTLAQTNINSWLHNFDKTLFVRTYEDSIRGILSDRYTVLDTPDIIESIYDAVGTDQYAIKGFFMSPDRFHARIVQKEMLKIEGEDLFAGIQVDSSDVGRSILQVEFFIFKQVCTNGLCIPKFGGSIFRQKHIGMGLSDFREMFSESMRNMGELCSMASELINNAMKDKNYLWRGNFSKLSDKEVEKIYSQITSSTLVSDEGAEKVVDLMRNKYGLSKWGYINSLTEVAQDYTLERRLDIEKKAGALLVA